NGGRMKAIEDATKPILQPMIHGNHPTSLSEDEQRILARWISLRSIIFATYVVTDSSELFFLEEDRIRFLASEEPLSNSIISMAAALPSVRVNAEPNCFALRPTHLPLGSGITFLETTGMIRQVAFQSIVCQKNWLPNNPIEPNSSVGQILKQIWPSNGPRRWPPSGSLGRTGYAALKGQFASHYLLSGKMPQGLE